MEFKSLIFRNKDKRMKQSREVNNTDRQEPKDEDDENVDHRP